MTIGGTLHETQRMNPDYRPSVLVGIDTEADDQWSASGRERNAVTNATRLPAVQALFEACGAKDQRAADNGRDQRSTVSHLRRW